jgi:hypothetical protein
MTPQLEPVPPSDAARAAVDRIHAEGPMVRLPLELVEHLVQQLDAAARETGWESLLRDAEGIRARIRQQFPE